MYGAEVCDLLSSLKKVFLIPVKDYPTIISLGEDFKPALKYRPYLAIYTMVVVAVI